MTGVEYDRVGLMLQDLLQDLGDAVAGVGNAAAIDHLESAFDLACRQPQLEPGRKGGLRGIGTTLDGRSTEDKDPPRPFRFDRSETCGAKKVHPLRRNLPAIILRNELEQRLRLMPAGDWVEIDRPGIGIVEPPQPQLQQEKGEHDEGDGQPTKRPLPPGGTDGRRRGCVR